MLRLVRNDETGLYLKLGPDRYRPGGATGLDGSYRMDAADLAAGDQVTVACRSSGGFPVMKIETPAGATIVWTTEYVLKHHGSAPR